MFELCCKILIGKPGNKKYVFTHNVHSVNITSGRKRISTTATIKLGNVDSFLGDTTVLNNAINVNDEVVVYLGYDGQLNEEFTGYVTEKLPNMPYELKCEDEMWKYRQRTITKSWASITLQNLLKEIAPGITLKNIPGITLTNFRINRATAAQALQQLRDTYGLDVYFRGKTLFAGLPYTEKVGSKIKYHFQKNVIKSNLVFKDAADIKLRVTAISMRPDNTKIEVTVGDPDGEERTLHFYNLSKEQLTEQAKQKLKFMKFTGYQGSLTTFGIPIPKHGDIAVFEDRFYPQKNSSNFIDEVITDYGTGGFRRTITPGLKEALR